MTAIQKQILQLDPDERLRLVQYIIDSVRFENFNLPDELSEAQKLELNRRIDKIEKGTAQYVSWDSIKVKARKA